MVNSLGLHSRMDRSLAARVDKFPRMIWTYSPSLSKRQYEYLRMRLRGRRLPPLKVCTMDLRRNGCTFGPEVCDGYAADHRCFSARRSPWVEEHRHFILTFFLRWWNLAGASGYLALVVNCRKVVASRPLGPFPKTMSALGDRVRHENASIQFLKRPRRSRLV